MSGRRLRTRKELTTPASPVPAVSTRPRRGTVNQAPPTTIERSSPDESRVSSIRLTVKADPKKLKEAISSSTAPKGRVAVNSRDTFVGGEIVSGARSSRKKAIVESDSEEDDEEEEEEEQEDFEEDAEGEDDDEREVDNEDEEMAEDDEEDAEGEDDEEMDDAPPIIPKGRAIPPNPLVKVTPAKPLLSVEEKEMALDDDDDEELSSIDDDEDLEGGDDGLGGALGDDDEEGLSDEGISRSATPDLSKLTRRQRAEAQGLMSLSNGSSMPFPLLSLLLYYEILTI
jgi:Ino eighty subunit 2